MDRLKPLQGVSFAPASSLIKDYRKCIIFSIENNDTVINYEVDKAMYKAYQYQILTPLQKIAIQNLTKLQLLKQILSY
jgi:hypothetical protein